MTDLASHQAYAGDVCVESAHMRAQTPIRGAYAVATPSDVEVQSARRASEFHHRWLGFGEDTEPVTANVLGRLGRLPLKCIGTVLNPLDDSSIRGWAAVRLIKQLRGTAANRKQGEDQTHPHILCMSVRSASGCS